ncbi:acyl carrier protein [Streptomyces armeniacus]|uniref:Acyl carrier protein n=1 Tax=Streptomyces armeniacus TaxID=83291 RepID=A0A345XT88_9ACTN|nr:acyl carrier protein [Streptomyces armeniacus]AXK34854.1 acyl carrier protein [Streptomyces armeniacus]
MTANTEEQAERARVHDRVVALLSEAAVVPREDIEDPRTNLREEIGLDSMDFIELVTVLERELGRRVEREQLSYVRTVGDVVDLVCALIKEHDSAGA